MGTIVHTYTHDYLSYRSLHTLVVSTMPRQYTLCARRNAATLAPRKLSLLITPVESRSARACVGSVNFQFLLTTPEGESQKMEPKNSPRELEEITDAKTLEVMATNWKMLSDLAKRGRQFHGTRSELLELVRYL